MTAMCEDCYTQAGRPYVVTDKVRRTVQLMYDAEQDNEANDLGNGMYLVTGNWNVEDSSIQWCLDNADLSIIERDLCNLMLTMSLEERHTAMAIDDHLVDSDIQVRPYWQAGDKVTVYPVGGGYVVVPDRDPPEAGQFTMRTCPARLDYSEFDQSVPRHRHLHVGQRCALCGAVRSG